MCFEIRSALADFEIRSALAECARCGIENRPLRWNISCMSTVHHDHVTKASKVTTWQNLSEQICQVVFGVHMKCLDYVLVT